MTGRAGALFERDVDVAPGGREFHGVAQKVHKNLTQPQRIAHDGFVRDTAHGGGKAQSRRLRLGRHEAGRRRKGFREAEDVLRETDAPGFDARHVKHFVDKRHQMMACACDLGEAVRDAPGVVGVPLGDVRHAENAVQRRADVVGDAVQKHRFGTVGAGGGIGGGRERRFLLLLAPHDVVHVS